MSFKFTYVADESRWPLIVCESPGPLHPSEIDQDSFYRELERLMARGERFATLHDLRGTAPDANRRKRFATWVNDHAPKIRKLVAAHAIVIDSSILQGIVTAVLWLLPAAPCPMRVFSDRQEAERWLLAMLEAKPRG